MPAHTHARTHSMHLPDGLCCCHAYAYICVCAAQVRTEAARSVAHKPLPPVPPDAADAVSLVLFYQYCEPQWSKKEHKEALKYVINLGKTCGVTGRGRCAAEGLNCTLTGRPEAVRAFCNGLREWKPLLFDGTDFKITDGLASHERFKALTIQKKNDLVAYGLPSEVAPALATALDPFARLIALAEKW